MSLFARSSKLTLRSLRSAPLNYTHTNNLVRGFRNSAVKMGVHNVANKTEFDAAINDHDVVILDAFATWCGPCKVIAPEVVKYSDEYPSAYFIKLDVDEVPDVAQELGIRAMPTFLIFKKGEKVSEVVGANKVALLAAIKDAAGA